VSQGGVDGVEVTGQGACLLLKTFDLYDGMFELGFFSELLGSALTSVDNLLTADILKESLEHRLL
jgi:hypothetical protein